MFFPHARPVRGPRRFGRGEALLKLISQPQKLLATILIANNLVNVTIVVLTNFALGPVFAGMDPVLSFALQTVLLYFFLSCCLAKSCRNYMPTTTL